LTPVGSADGPYGPVAVALRLPPRLRTACRAAPGWVVDGAEPVGL